MSGAKDNLVGFSRPVILPKLPYFTLPTQRFEGWWNWVVANCALLPLPAKNCNLLTPNFAFTL